MTTTARELAEGILKKLVDEHANGGEAFVSEGYGYYDDALNYFSEAILDAEARGRESVLSRVPSKEKIIDYFQDTGDATFFHAWLLAKLKEPT